VSGNDARARVLLLGPALDAVSGVSTHLRQLLQSDLARDFDIRHFQVGSEGRREHGLARAVRLFASPWALGRQLARFKPQVVHINTSLDHKAFWRDALYLLVAKAMGTRVVCQVHGGAALRFAAGLGVFRFTFKWLLRLPDALVILSEAERAAYRALGLGRETRLVPNAIHLDAYGPMAHGAKPGAPMRLVYAGRLADDKGVFEAVEAMGLLRAWGFGADPILLLAGSGPAERQLRAKVRAMGLEDRVTFVGPLQGPALVRFWQEADLFVFPTFHQEGLPYAVLESLAAGTPVITTRTGGIPDVVQEGVHGLFVAPQDPHALAGAIARLVRDPERLRAMARNCIARAHAHYGVARMTGQMREIYGELLRRADARVRKRKAPDPSG